MSRALYAIGTDLEALDELMEERGGDVTDPEILAAVESWLGELGAERDAKLDRYAGYIADLEERAVAKKREVNRLEARMRAEETRVRFLKDRLLDFLRRQGVKSIDTTLHRFTVAGNGGKQPVEIRATPEDLPAAYQRVGFRITVVRGAAPAEALATLESLLPKLNAAGGVAEQEIVPATDLIRARLESGDTLSFAALGERGFHLRIR